MLMGCGTNIMFMISKAIEFENRATYLFTFLFVALAFLVIGIFAPITVTVWIMCEESIICFSCRLNVILWVE